MCVPGGCLPTHMIGMAVLQVMLSSVDHIVEALQLVFQQADSLRPRLLRFSQGGGDVLQIGADLGKLLRLRAKGFDEALHFGGIIDRVVAVLVIPGRVEAFPGLLKCVIGFGRVASGSVKSLSEAGYLRGAAGLKALVDRPRIAAGFRDQLGDAQPLQLHSRARGFAVVPVALRACVGRCDRANLASIAHPFPRQPDDPR